MNDETKRNERKHFVNRKDFASINLSTYLFASIAVVTNISEQDSTHSFFYTRYTVLSL